MGTKRKRRKLKPVRLIIVLAALAFLIFAGAALGLVALSIKDLPAWNEGKLFSNASTLIYDKDSQLVAKVGEENRVPVSLSEIPEDVQEAFLAAEDHRFYEHHGIVLRAIARAAVQDVLNQRLDQGGSTITMQLVKLSFLNPEKKFKRKIQEVILTFMVENKFTKEEILEMYLNKIYLGEGAYGIQSAAQTYFDKEVSELDISEAAVLAALPQAPSALSPLRNPEGALNRRNLVLDKMAEYNYITPQQRDEAKAKPLNIKEGSSTDQYPAAYFIDYVTEQLIDKYGDQVSTGGLRVYTTLDRDIQKAAENAFNKPANFPASVRDAQNVLQPQGAAVVLDPKTGYIRAIIGGREHTHKLGFNRATDTPGRQPGSTFKPIAAYGPAIEYKGLGPATVIDDIPTRYGSYEPKNSDGRYRGLITLRSALTHSVNIAAVKVLMDHVGISEAANFARGLGIGLNPNSLGASMALGSKEVTPLQLAAAYGAFANQGIYSEPTAVLRVEAPDGTVLFEHRPKQHQAMKPTTAYLITDMLKSVVQSGTGTNARIGRPQAGKTGTSDKAKDIWFAGYTPDLVGVVYIGYDDPKSMQHAFGGTFTAGIWRQIMSEALKNVPARDFPRPSGLVSASVDSKSGMRPGPNTPPQHIVTDLFVQGTVPTAVDDTHVLMEVCATTGQLPSEYCPERLTKVLVKLPYTVPKSVADFADRAPTEVCTVHSPGNWDPNQPWPPVENSPPGQAGGDEIIPGLQQQPESEDNSANNNPAGNGWNRKKWLQ